MSEIRNFDELAQDTKFSFKGITYIIPAITNKKALDLFNMGKRVKSKELTEELDLDDKNKESEFVNEQAEFICAVVLDEAGNAVTVEQVSQWPMKVSLAVVKLINECITGIKEDTPEEKK